MQGIYMGTGRLRPATKAIVRAGIKADPSAVYIEATSLFGNEYDGPVSDMPVGTIIFVGPDPATNRRFYGNIKRDPDGKITVT